MSENNTEQFDHIAIIGMAGRFPGAKDVNQLWSNLVNGIESITFFSDEELKEAGVDPSHLNAENYVKARSFVKDVEDFDADFFKFNPMEATMMDPQHRVFLECAWESLENAGYNPEAYKGRIGLYAGCDTNTYLLYNIILSNPFLTQSDTLQIKMNDKDYLCTRVSYKLGLNGPSMMVQSACSTSLVAVHLACESILNGECDMALAGAVSITLPQKTGYFYQAGGVVSPDGHCRAFDSEARGTVYGDGVGVVVLKRLVDAIDDRDHIYAVIRGSAVNNDGSARVGYTAPGVKGQAEVITEALSVADIDAETVGYIETHGTGTELGDSVEIAALMEAFRHKADKKQFCAIGSIKTNIGHISTASGIASLIKTALCLKHKVIPPSLNFEKANPNIDFENSPFFVNTVLRQWEADDVPRRAGVSAFGLGGTNAHVVLEEALHKEALLEPDTWKLFVLSAKTSTALEAVTDNLMEYLKVNPDVNLSDAAYTLQVGRKDFEFRRVVVARHVKELTTVLEKRDPKYISTGAKEKVQPCTAFMFTGLGNQYDNMSLELYQSQPIFKYFMDKCIYIIKQKCGFDISEIMCTEHTHIPSTENNTFSKDYSRFDLSKMFGAKDNNTVGLSERLKRPSIAYPFIFSVEYALAHTFMELGIIPQAMIGHSIGEYVAACIAGVFSLEDALFLITRRGQLIEQLPEGAMLSVMLAEEKLLPFLGPEISLSTINSPSSCVVGGKEDAIKELESTLLKQGIACRQVPTTHAYHSKMMEPVLEKYEKVVKTVKLNSPNIPFVSNVTGNFITEAQAVDHDYWVRHMRMTVRFSDGIKELLKEPTCFFVEIGPGNTLGSLVLQHSDSNGATNRIISSMRAYYDMQSDMHFFLSALGKLWISGIQVDWQKLYKNVLPYRIPLPTYPFERKRFWLEPTKNSSIFTKEQEHEQEINYSDQSIGNTLLYERPELRAVYIPPTTITEQKMVEIWQNTLGINKVGVEDDFFELGGNSLLAVKAVFEIRKTFQVDIPMSVLIKQPTITFLSNYVDTVQWVGGEQDNKPKDSNIPEDSSEGWEEIEI